MKKRILSLLLSTALVAAALVNPMVSKANSEEAGAPTEMTIDEFRTEKTSGTDADGNAYEYYTKVPTAPEGYVFGGWYTTEDCDVAIPKTQTAGTAWAKWVEKDVLAVKYQVSASTTAASETTNMRLVTSVDSENYRAVGFVLNYGQGDSKPAMSKDVYSSIKGLVDGVETYYYANQEFDTTSQYFMIYEIYNIPQSVFGASINVTPQWETLDGTVVTGTANTVKISDVYADKVTVNADGSVTVQNTDLGGHVEYAFTNLDIKAGAEVKLLITTVPGGDPQGFFVIDGYKNGEEVGQQYIDADSAERYLATFTATGDIDELKIIYRHGDWSLLGNMSITFSIESIKNPDQVTVNADGSVTVQNTDLGGHVEYAFTNLDIKAGAEVKVLLVTVPGGDPQGFFTINGYKNGEEVGQQYIDADSAERYLATFTATGDIDELKIIYRHGDWSLLGNMSITFSIESIKNPDQVTVNGDGSVTVQNADLDGAVFYTFTNLDLKAGDKVTFTMTVPGGNPLGFMWIEGINAGNSVGAIYMDSCTSETYTRTIEVSADLDSLKFAIRNGDWTALGNVSITFKIDTITCADRTTLNADGSVTVQNTDGDGGLNYTFTNLDIKAGDSITFTITVPGGDPQGFMGVDGIKDGTNTGAFYYDACTSETYTRTITATGDFDALKFWFRHGDWTVLGNMSITFKLN